MQMQMHLNTVSLATINIVSMHQCTVGIERMYHGQGNNFFLQSFQTIFHAPILQKIELQIRGDKDSSDNVYYV